MGEIKHKKDANEIVWVQIRDKLEWYTYICSRDTYLFERFFLGNAYTIPIGKISTKK